MADLPLTLEALTELFTQQPALMKKVEVLPQFVNVWCPQPGKQSDAYFSMADETLYGGAAGGGKGLHVDELLPCPSGFVRMGDVQVGDTLFDADGDPCTVTATSGLNHRHCFEVVFSDGSTIVADDVHRWSTYTLQERTQVAHRNDAFRARRVRATVAEPVKPWLSELNRNREHPLLAPPAPGVRDTAEIARTLTARGRTNHSVAVCGALRAPEIALPLDPYILGAWLGDGSSYKAEITTADADMLTEFETAGYRLKQRTPITYGVYGLLPTLRAMGLLANKHVPPGYMRASIRQRRSVVQGLMDTDGYCDKRGQCEFTSTRRALADGMHELLCSLGVKATIAESRAMLYGRDCGPKYRIKFVADFPAFRLPRKLERQTLDPSLNARTRYIVDVRPVASVPTRCVAVDSPSRTYLASRSFIPTHNTDLLLGLATTAHERSVIFRPQSVELTGLWGRLQEIIPKPAKEDNQRRIMKTKDGRTIEGSHLELPGSERSHMGRARDFYGFDEAALFDEMRVNFVTQWLRSANDKQRCRVVFATNPPMPAIRNGVMTDTAVGDWLLRWFAPWIDETYQNLAAEGELRWCFMEAEGDRLVTHWVEGPGFYDRVAKQRIEAPSDADRLSGKYAFARSRTFIRAKVQDNLFYANSGYAEKLSSTPEPLRSMLLNGDFTIKGEDHPMQIIPTQWVLAAQERHKAREWREVKHLRQLVLAGDIAQGGLDTTVIATLYETDYFDDLITSPGSATPTGNEVEALILEARLDRSIVVLDGQGGWAGETRGFLSRDHGIDAEMFISSATDGTWTPDMLYEYGNLRAKMWWQFRIALDPKNGYDVCLPNSPRLRAQLTAAHYKVRGRRMLVEDKDEIRKRIGSSTDEADAVVMAWQFRDEAVAATIDPAYDIVERLNGRVPTKGRGYEPVPMDDPRGEW